MKNILFATLLTLGACTTHAAEQLTWQNPALRELLAYLQVKNDGTLSSMVQATQQAWVRPANKELWQLDDLPEAQRAVVLNYAQRLGFIDEVKPVGTHYEFSLVLGGTINGMRNRIEYLRQQWEQGTRFRHLVFLVSERPLDPTIETEAKEWGTEGEAARQLWAQATLPTDLRNVDTTFIVTPLQHDAQGGIRRPSRADTLTAWKATNPVPGSCLLISSQPFVSFDQAIARNILSKDFFIETVGAAASTKNLKATVVLDTIARWLYAVEQQSRNV